MFKFLVLGFLRDRLPHHGYALAKAYSEQSGAEISTGKFYRELQRLVDDGLIHTVANPADADPRRAPYQITDLGCYGFDEWLTAPVDLGDGHSEDAISGRALFLREADPRLVARLLERWKEQLWVRGKVLERARDSARAKRFDVLALLLGRRLKYTAADIEFLETLQSTVAQLAPQVAIERLAPALRALPESGRSRESATAGVRGRR